MVDRETVEQIANSMTYYQEDGISYEVDEIPDGYEMKFQFESNGAMQNEWVKSGSVLTWIVRMRVIGWQMDTTVML